MMFGIKRKTEFYSISGFLNHDKPLRTEGGISQFARESLIATGLVVISVAGTTLAIAQFSSLPFQQSVVMASTGFGISQEYDKDIWPLFIDIGKPIAKTMMALGIYKVMRNDDKGWKTVQRSGMGLVCLYMIDVGINLLTGIGEHMDHHVAAEFHHDN